MKLKRRATKAFFWNSLENMTRLGLNFVIGIILARLIEPSEFGLIGMISIFIAFSNLFIDSGFSQSLIRKKECTINDFNTVFIFNIVVSLICYSLIFIFAPFIAKFYKQPSLVAITRIYGIILILQSFSIVQNTKLIKNLDFTYRAKVHIISSLLGGIAAIALAYKGAGVWSLVYQQVIRQISINILLWNKHAYKCKLSFDKIIFKEHFSFGIKIFFSGLIYSISHNIYYLVIGKVFSAQNLGFYTKAEQFNALPSKNLMSVIGNVSYPLLAKIQDSPEQLLSAYKKLTIHSTYVVFLGMIGLATMAKKLIFVLIGSKWLTTAEYLQIICLSSMVLPLHILNLNVLKIKGRSDLFLRIEVAKQFLIIPTVIIGAITSIKTMLWLMVLVSYLGLFINSFYTGRLISYGIFQQLKDVSANYVLAFGVGFITYAVSLKITINTHASLLIQIIVFLLSIVIISFVTNNSTYKFILHNTRPYLKKYSNYLNFKQ